MTGGRIRHKRKGTFLKLGFFLYLGFCLFAGIWLKAAVVNLEYELGDLERMRTELISETRRVSAQRANYYASEKIEKVALKDLGMTLSEREDIYFIRRTAAAGPFKASMK